MRRSRTFNSSPLKMAGEEGDGAHLEPGTEAAVNGVTERPALGWKPAWPDCRRRGPDPALRLKGLEVPKNRGPRPGRLCAGTRCSRP